MQRWDSMHERNTNATSKRKVRIESGGWDLPGRYRPAWSHEAKEGQVEGWTLERIEDEEDRLAEAELSTADPV